MVPFFLLFVADLRHLHILTSIDSVGDILHFFFVRVLSIADVTATQIDVCEFWFDVCM